MKIERSGQHKKMIRETVTSAGKVSIGREGDYVYTSGGGKPCGSACHCPVASDRYDVMCFFNDLIKSD
jgi:hypothetical protein